MPTIAEREKNTRYKDFRNARDSARHALVHHQVNRLDRPVGVHWLAHVLINSTSISVISCDCKQVFFSSHACKYDAPFSFLGNTSSDGMLVFECCAPPRLGDAAIARESRSILC